MFAFFWTYLLPSTGLALLAALLWSVRRERRLAVELAQLKVHFDETGYRLTMALDELARVQRGIEEWKYAAVQAAKKMNEAKDEAQASQSRFDLLVAKIKDSPVPEDAEGALAWMASVAKDLAAEVGR